jgi:hypothetical protein
VRKFWSLVVGLSKFDAGVTLTVLIDEQLLTEMRGQCRRNDSSNDPEPDFGERPGTNQTDRQLTSLVPSEQS